MTKPEDDRMLAFLDEIADYDQTGAEARAELEASGVDVDGFLARLRKRIGERGPVRDAVVATLTRERDEARAESERHLLGGAGWSQVAARMERERDAARQSASTLQVEIERLRGFRDEAERQFQAKVIELAAEVERATHLRRVIEGAPHDSLCRGQTDGPRHGLIPCTCWKARALRGGVT